MNNRFNNKQSNINFRKLPFFGKFSRIILSFLLSVFFINACLAIYDYYYLQRLNPAYLKISKVKNFDTRSASSFGYDEFGKENFQLAGSPQFNISSSREDQISLSPSPNTNIVLCNEHGNFVTYKSDLFGFRNENESIYENFDIMLIGDSYAHGYCEESNNTISGYLNALGTKTLNLGIGGSGLFTYARVLETFSLYLRNDTSVVLLSYFNNDVNDTKVEAQTILGNGDIKVSLNYLKQNRLNHVPLNEQPLSNFDKFASRDCEGECGSHYLYWKSNEKKFFKSIKTIFYIRMLLKYITKRLYDFNEVIYKPKLSKTNLNYHEVDSGLEMIKTITEKIPKENRNGCFFFIIYGNGQFNKNEFDLYLNAVSRKLGDTWIVNTITDENLGSSQSIYRKTGGHLGPIGYNQISKKIQSFLVDNECKK